MPRTHKALMGFSLLYFIFIFLSFHPTWIDLITGTVFYPMISFMGVFVVIISGWLFIRNEVELGNFKAVNFIFLPLEFILWELLLFLGPKVVGFLLLTFLNIYENWYFN